MSTSGVITITIAKFSQRYHTKKIKILVMKINDWTQSFINSFVNVQDFCI